MIGRGFHSGFHGGFHHAGSYGGLGSPLLLTGIISAGVLIAAVWWVVGCVQTKSDDGEPAPKRRELGLPPDRDGA